MKKRSEAMRFMCVSTYVEIALQRPMVFAYFLSKQKVGRKQTKRRMEAMRRAVEFLVFDSILFL